MVEKSAVSEKETAKKKKKKKKKDKEKADPVDVTDTKEETESKKKTGASKKKSPLKDTTTPGDVEILEAKTSVTLPTHETTPSHLKESRAKTHTDKLQTKMRNQLDGARFRFVNEQLYTTTGSEALDLFQKDEQLFRAYHHGFATQVAKWPVNPLDCIIAWLKKK